jgi:hypothetical protein
VVIGLDGATSTALHASGKTITTPVRARGLLDTGSSHTSIASWLVQHLAMAPISKAKTQTASGAVEVLIFSVSIAIEGQPALGIPDLLLPTVIVHEFPATLADADVLVGRNVLFEFNLFLEGPARRFTLEY